MDLQKNNSPFKELMETTKTPEECINVLFEDQRLRYFFEVAVSSAKLKKEPLGHTLFVCPDTETKECFISLLRSYIVNSDVRVASLSQETKPGDLSAMLTNLKENDIFLIDNAVLSIKQDNIDILKKAITNFSLECIIGKGPAARILNLDLNKFTAVVCVEKTNKCISSLLKHFSYVIKIDEENLPKLCKAKIKSICNFTITEESCDFISYKAKYDINTCVNYLNRVIEYLEFKNIETTITKDLVEEIFDMVGIGTNVEDVMDDELLSIFKEIRDSLHEIKDDIHTIKDSVKDFIATSGKD